MSAAEAYAVQRALFAPRPGVDVRWADALIAREFADPALDAAATRRHLAAMLRHALTHVPFYASRAAGVDPTAVTAADLARLPVIDKATVAAAGAAMHARALPPGDALHTLARTSGTTGRPLEVLRSRGVALWFSRLKCRELRWWRLDPRTTLAAIRPFSELPYRPDGAPLQPGDLLRVDRWPHAGDWFHTGVYLAFANTNPVDHQVAMLRHHRPAHLIAQAAGLEHLALTASGPLDGLRSALAISQTLTPTMRGAIERRLAVPVHQNYGLNEVGLVATRCVEGGRYHVHTEAAHVDLLDADGAPAAPGTAGRIVVTGLANTAMPLLRYDSGDVAEVVDGPCPCGRTLPAFGAVSGRYRRTACLPDGTWARWGAIQHAMWALPDALHSAVRQYQAHHHRDGRFTLRLHGDPTDADAVRAHVRDHLARVPGPPTPCELLWNIPFHGPPSGKFQSFVSECYDDLPAEGV